MPREHIPARKGFDEQWRFDPPEPSEIYAAVRDGSPDQVIVGPDEKLVRFLVYFDPSDSFPQRHYGTDRYAHPEPDPYRTAWVRLGTLRTLFGGATRAGQGPGVVSRFAELFLGWPVGWIERVVSVTLANG